MKRAIYGAGEYGIKLLNLLNSVGVKVNIFVQTFRTDKTDVAGIPVISYDEFIQIQEKYIVYLAINNEDVIEEIENKFKNDGYDMHNLFNMQAFLNQNHYVLHDGDRKCPLCKKSFENFLPGGVKSDFFLQKHIIGGGYRENAICPYCGSIDRTRWVYWVAKKFTNIFETENRVLHFAPESYLRKLFEKNEKCDYYPADLQNNIGGLKVHRIDVTQIPFKEEFADYIIINHVLEHVLNESTAIYEMKRVLKQNGKIIMSFPVSMEENTLEDYSIVAEEERKKYYGQKDHVRLYGKDFKKRLETYGLNVVVYSPKDYMNEEVIEQYGLIADDIVLLCTKNQHKKENIK